MLDALGGRSSGNVLGYIVWLNFLDGIPFSFSIFFLRRSVIKKKLKNELMPGLGIGILGTIAYAIVIWSLTFSPMAYVSALRETSVIIAAWIGCKLLKEPFGNTRMITALLIFSGVLLIQFK